MRHRFIYRVAASLALLLAACGGGWVVTEDIPPDLEELVTGTMERIEQALPAQADCLRDLTVSHAWELDDRAEYRTESGTVVLRVPATAPDLEFSLAHEVAHHLELTCDSQAGMRSAFLAAQGQDAKRPWFEGDSWETTPSEQFATAIGHLVTGRPDPMRNVSVTEEAMELVHRWARDGTLEPPD